MSQATAIDQATRLLQNYYPNAIPEKALGIDGEAWAIRESSGGPYIGPSCPKELSAWMGALEAALVEKTSVRDVANSIRGSFCLRIAQEANAEITRAEEKHGSPIWARHEFAGIFLEEVDELWECIKTNAPKEKLREEAIQVIAVIMRFLILGERNDKATKAHAMTREEFIGIMERGAKRFGMPELETHIKSTYGLGS